MWISPGDNKLFIINDKIYESKFSISDLITEIAKPDNFSKKFDYYFDNIFTVNANE